MDWTGGGAEKEVGKESVGEVVVALAADALEELPGYMVKES